MRFLGPAADATAEVATYDQLPSGGGGLAKGVASDFAYGTSATDITSLAAALGVGTWALDLSILHTHTGSASVPTMRLNFSGTATGNFTVLKVTGTTITTHNAQSYNANVAMSNGTPAILTISGVIVVTVAGTLTPNFVRAASTTGVVNAGSWLTVTQVS